MWTKYGSHLNTGMFKRCQQIPDCDSVGLCNLQILQNNLALISVGNLQRRLLVRAANVQNFCHLCFWWTVEWCSLKLFPRVSMLQVSTTEILFYLFWSGNFVLHNSILCLNNNVIIINFIIVWIDLWIAWNTWLHFVFSEFHISLFVKFPHCISVHLVLFRYYYCF